MAEAMESVSCSEPKRSYSWWWDSHITPKNSKWLQENLADMDSKIESMIKLIEEDADSFARRAEMYYKKRPELMKLVEEFYRAYRALAERYDHVTGALRQAHRTIAVAFPNQIQFILPDEPPSALPDTVEEVKDNFTSPSYSNGSREPAGDNIPFMSKEEWKQLNCLLAEDEAQKKFAECFLMKGLNLNKSLRNQIISEPEISQNREEDCHRKDDICVNVTTFDATEERRFDLEKESRSTQSELNNFDEIVSRQMEEDLDLSKKNQNLHNKIESESFRAELAEAELCRLSEISCTGDQFANDSTEMPIGSSILNIGEEQYIILQEENNSLKHTVDEFKNIVARQEEEVTLKEEQSNRFTQSVEDERNRQTIAKVANDQSLKKQHSQCEEKIRPPGLGILSGTEMRKLSRAELGELKKFNEEDNYLNVKSFSYISEIGGLQDDINSPRGSKLEIADETKVREDVSYYLKNKSTPYHELKRRIGEVNFNLVSLQALITELHDLKREPKGFNLEDSRLMKSTSDTKYYCESAQRDSPNHESQNAALVSHVEAADQSIKKLWEKSRFFENFLSDIFVEFEGLRGKMKALEESCQSLFHQNCDLIAELENLKQDMQSLEDRFSNFEGNYVTTEKENDLFRSEKEGPENRVLFFRNQTSDLNNQIQILREENEHLNEELEDEQHKTVKSGIDFCIMQNFLYDMNEKNRILSDECQMHMKKLRRAEKLASKFKQDQLVQEKILALLLEYDKKLSEWMHLMLMALDSKDQDCVTSEGGNKDMMHLISHKMVDLQVSVSDSNEEFQHLQIKKSPFTVLLEQLRMSLVHLRAQKNVLQQESEMLNEEISLLHGKNYELTEVNEKMRNDFTASYRQKEELNIEMEEMHKKVSELLAGRFISHGEIPVLLAETLSLSNKLYELKEQKKAALNGESQVIHDHLSNTFSSDTEKSSTIDQVASGVPNPNGITNNLDHEISVNNGNMTASQHGNMHSETKNVLPIELEMNLQILLKENARKDDEIGFLRQSNNKFVTESSIWHKNAEALRRREKFLTAELQRAKDESKHFEEELAACLFDIHVASINGFIYEEKIVELVLKLKNLEAFDSLYSEMPIGEGSLRNVQRKTLMEKLHVLENENKGLKEELSGYLPLVASLDNDITSLEELTLSPANHHILSSKKKQDNTVLAPHQTMKFIQVRGEDHIPTVLKKLHATVKLLQKKVSNTERLLAREETVVDSNLLCKTRENKAERSKGNTAQLETEKKKDIAFDSRKSNASDENVRLNQKFSNLKHDHITKDIELDHVLSIRSDFHADSDEQSPKMLEAAVNYVKEDQEIEIMEKELSIDTIELPENASKSHQEWSMRIGEILSSDALRLAALQKNVEEMKNMGSVLSTVNEQLKASEAVIMQLTDINFKLARTAHNFTANLDDHEDNGRWKISDRVQRASEKIGEVELELQNTQKSLLEIQEEEEESKEAKALQRKSRISFKSFLYGRSADSRKKKRRFCSCLGLSNKDD
ncbi:hypothetical protein KSP39_PZI000514 [Platanthera zijinensis]|uniref:NAB domain-containing protein n=1 Tax=Platanthera zijinensis TaxID=2320716 RepID=A0AAP0C1H5_9ASPA